jgi:hypothetical protein
MRYMFLIYGREAAMAERSSDDWERVKAAHWAVIDEAGERGILHAAEPLQPTATATTIRIERDRPLILDGPFAETKEQLLGFYIVDCPTLDDAIAAARDLKEGESGGAFEIRPLRLYRPGSGAG